jgi:hypothetical protein
MEDLEDSPNFQSFSPHVFWGSKQGDCRFFGTLSIGQGRIAGEKKKCKTGRRFSRFAAKIRGWEARRQGDGGVHRWLAIGARVSSWEVSLSRRPRKAQLRTEA